MRTFIEQQDGEVITHTLPLSEAESAARETYCQVDALVVEFVRELGGWQSLPEGFDVGGSGWFEAEAAIDAAAGRGDLSATRNLCAAYLARVERYLSQWRAKAQR